MLIGSLYAPRLAPNDERVIKALNIIEAALAIKLNRPLQSKEGILVPPDGLIAHAEPSSRPEFVRISCLPWRPLDSLVSSYILFEVSESPTFLARADTLFGDLAQTLVAFWAVFSPENAAAIIADQIPKARESVFSLLPPLQKQRELPPDIPQRLGWINFWSDTVLSRMGLTAMASLKALTFRFRKSKTGCLFQLTRELLNLERPDHLEVLRAVYEKCPAIGHIANDSR